MSEYISREAAKNYVIGRYDDQLGFITMEDIIDQLDYVPAADVRPVIRGKWVSANEQSNGGTVYCFSCCSECGRKTATNTDFCPNCGADMRKEIEHD